MKTLPTEYHLPTAEQEERILQINAACKELEKRLKELAPPALERRLAMNALEECRKQTIRALCMHESPVDGVKLAGICGTLEGAYSIALENGRDEVTVDPEKLRVMHCELARLNAPRD